jgi:hypothetical protein
MKGREREISNTHPFCNRRIGYCFKSWIFQNFCRILMEEFKDFIMPYKCAKGNFISVLYLTLHEERFSSVYS